jgi:hypothetical protein
MMSDAEGPSQRDSARTGEAIPGSPLNALSVSPPFARHFLIDGDSVESLRRIIGQRAGVTRLQEAAGFKYVPEPLGMRNGANAVVYYLFFASQKETASKIATSILRRYAGRGVA